MQGSIRQATSLYCIISLGGFAGLTTAGPRNTKEMASKVASDSAAPSLQCRSGLLISLWAPPPLGGFAGLYNGWAGSFQAEPGYSTHPDSELPVAFKVEDGDNFPYGASRSNPPPAPALFRGAAPSAPAPATPAAAAAGDRLTEGGTGSSSRVESRGRRQQQQEVTD